jgi:hypothetical protein
MLKGRLIGKVATVIHETPYMTPTSRLKSIRGFLHFYQRMDDWQQSAWALAASLETYQTYLTGEEIFEVFWRTLILNREALGKTPSQEFEWEFKSWNTAFAQFRDESLIEPTNSSKDDQPLTASLLVKINLSKSLLEDGAPYEHAFLRFAPGRKFCTTSNGYMGWVPSAVQAGDVFCLFEDCRLPFVLRRCEKGYKLIGEAYLHGLMDPGGQLYLVLKQGLVGRQNIILV